MALDVGDRRIGVAVADDSGASATPLQSIPRRGGEADGRAIADLMRQHKADRLVVGLPLSVAGDEGTQARRTRAFVERLAAVVDAPIDLVDEAFSTVEAAERLRAGSFGRVRRSHRRTDIDAAAAAVILQRYLDRQRPSGGEG